MAFEDPADRIDRLVSALEPAFRAAFMEVVRRTFDENSLHELEDLLSAGRYEEALAAVESHAAVLGAEWARSFTTAAENTEAFLMRNQVRVVYNQVNARAVSAMQSNRLRLVREFSQQQRAATAEALVNGVREGVNPREMALRFRESIGLTQAQQRMVDNYRHALQRGDKGDALGRELRDRRFDPTVRNLDKAPLTGQQIDRMVERYRERFLKYRSEVIARTESLRSVHEGNQEMYRQAVESGDLDPTLLQRKWEASGDSRVRDSHRHMDGQVRGLDEPFKSGDGNNLQYPGDINAPASDSIQCRCRIGTTLLPNPEFV